MDRVLSGLMDGEPGPSAELADGSAQARTRDQRLCPGPTGGPATGPALSTIRYSRRMRSESTAARLLRDARRRAGLSQTDLAARAGVTQSVISAYESGHRQPAIPTLTALIEATGHELVLSLRQERQGLARLSGPVGRRVRRNRHRLVAAAAAHGITGLRVFGSVARGDDRPDSDVDMLADLPADLGLFGLGRVEAELEDILNARVDLAPAGSLKPQVRERVERELVPL